MNSIKSNNLTLKYQRITSSGFKDREIKKMGGGEVEEKTRMT